MNLVNVKKRLVMPKLVLITPFLPYIKIKCIVDKLSITLFAKIKQFTIEDMKCLGRI
jgi:hypothetical protein